MLQHCNTYTVALLPPCHMNMQQTLASNMLVMNFAYEITNEQNQLKIKLRNLNYNSHKRDSELYEGKSFVSVIIALISVQEGLQQLKTISKECYS